MLYSSCAITGWVMIRGDAYREQESQFLLWAISCWEKSYQRLGRKIDDAAKAFQRAVELRSNLAPLADS